MENITYEEFINNILDTRGRFNCGEEYHERHHIVPKCMGGSNDEENLIDLFAREHFEAHRLLALENPSNKGLQFAWWNMCQCSGMSKKRETVTPEEYEEARRVIAEKYSGENHPSYGRHLSEETKKKIRDANIKRFQNPEERKKISDARKGEKNPNYGIPKSEEIKRKIGESNKGKIRSEEVKQKISKTLKGKYVGEGSNRARSVIQYDLSGNLIRVWGCITQAAQELGINRQHISGCCKKEKGRKTVGGFIWRYSDEIKQNNLDGDKMQKNIRVINDVRGLESDEIIEKILDSRGIYDIFDFLNPSEDSIIPFEELNNIDKAYEIITKNIEENNKIFVHFDTDNDGLCSGNIAYRWLKDMCSNVDCGINQGKEHGIENIDLSLLEGVSLLWIVDSIQQSIEPYERILNSGVKDILITDHHLISDELIHKMNDNGHIILVSSAVNYPNPQLSGSGVTWKVCAYADSVNWNNISDNLIDCCAAGIVSDMCDLSVPENRYLVSRGLNNLVNPGIKKIIGGYEFNSSTIMFSLAPIVNSANRLYENEKVLKLFISNDDVEIKSLIKELKKCKDIQNEIVAELMPLLEEQIQSQIGQKCMFFIIPNNLKASITGLIGNKLLEKVQVPLFVLQDMILKDGSHEMSGSMRAVGVESFEKYIKSTNLGWVAGHENAAGFGIHIDDYEKFKIAIQDTLKDVEFKQEIVADIQINPNQINDWLIEQTKMFNKISGSGFKPINVYMQNITDYEVCSIGDGKHLKLELPNGVVLIKWNYNGDFEELKNKKVSVIGTLDSSFLGKTRYRQVIISDIIVKRC